MKDCFYFSVPDEFQSETKKHDEAYFSNTDEESDIDIILLDIPKDEKGNLEEMKKIVLGDMSKFIPEYKQIDEEKISSDLINGYLTKATSYGENEKEMKVETTVCISSDQKHYLIINIIYPKDKENKYSNLSENLVKSIKKQSQVKEEIKTDENAIKGEI